MKKPVIEYTVLLYNCTHHLGRAGSLPLQSYPTARWTEKFCGFLSHKKFYGMQVLDLTSLGCLRWARAKRAFPACPCCLSCTGAGMYCPWNVPGPSLEVLGFFSPKANNQTRKCCNPAKENLKLGRETPAKKRKKSAGCVSCCHHQDIFFSTVMAGRQS